MKLRRRQSIINNLASLCTSHGIALHVVPFLPPPAVSIKYAAATVGHIVAQSESLGVNRLKDVVMYCLVSLVAVIGASD